MTQFRHGDFETDIGLMLQDKFKKYNSEVFSVMSLHSINAWDDVLFDELDLVVPKVMTDIKLEAVDYKNR